LLTVEQAEVLAIVIMDSMAARRRIEEVRGRPVCRSGQIAREEDRNENVRQGRAASREVIR
jgi:hypothetical protein